MKLSPNRKRQFNRAAGIALGCTGVAIGLLEILRCFSVDVSQVRTPLVSGLAVYLFMLGNKIDQENISLDR